MEGVRHLCVCGLTGKDNIEAKCEVEDTVGEQEHKLQKRVAAVVVSKEGRQLVKEVEDGEFELIMVEGTDVHEAIRQ